MTQKAKERTFNEKEWKQRVLKELSSLPGIGKTIALKLFDAGYVSINLLAVTSPRILAEETGIGEKTAEKIVEAARQVTKLDFSTALDFYKKEKMLNI